MRPAAAALSPSTLTLLDPLTWAVEGPHDGDDSMSFAFLPLYVGDYLKDTQHLTPQKHGVYLKLLMHCWSIQGPVPLDEQEAAGIANCRSADEIDSLRYVLGRYFTKMDDGWYQKRMQLEIERAENLSERRAFAGRKGYEAKAKSLKQKDVQASAKQVLSKSQAIASTPTPTLTPTPTPRKDLKHSLGFAEFWTTYPHYPNRSSKAKSWERWTKMNLEAIVADVMQALRACIAIPTWTKNDREFVCAAEVWLNKRLWEQELVSLSDRLIESIISDPRFADMKP